MDNNQLIRLNLSLKSLRNKNRRTKIFIAGLLSLIAIGILQLVRQSSPTTSLTPTFSVKLKTTGEEISVYTEEIVIRKTKKGGYECFLGEKGEKPKWHDVTSSTSEELTIKFFPTPPPPK